MGDYIKSFIIGSSLATFILPVFGTHLIYLSKRNYTDIQYLIIAPLYFGLSNAISLYVAKQFNLSLNTRMLLSSLISIVVVLTFVKINKVYVFTSDEWIKYYIGLVLLHLFVFNIVIYYLESILM